jgi:deferrochelatase/peroxidase EfeB
MSLPDPEDRSRRDYLRGLVAAGGTAALSACVDFLDSDEPSEQPGDPSNRPASQHAWNPALETDEFGTIRPPKHHVLVPLGLVDEPTAGDHEQVESAFRSLERAYPYSTDGLLFTVGYSPGYFERIGVDAPIPEPRALTSFEAPEFDEFDALVQLASDRPDAVLAAEEALLGTVDEANGVEMAATLSGVFERSEPRRTGFVGQGLPEQFAEEIGGVPEEMPDDAPFFMGFRSGFTNSQASEDRVTIQEGPYEGGTTTHVESLDIDLVQWFEQDDHWLRVAQSFSPEHADEEMVGTIGEKLGATTAIETQAHQTEEDDRQRGVVGHAQKTARARDDDGQPRLLRRDFNTIDRDVPGVHFLAHQRTIDDFVRVREAMAGEDLEATVNNGLLQYVFVIRRGNFIVPPREKRSLPEL